MRIAESECGSSPSAFIRLKASRQEIPASTKILVLALATIAQLPRLPDASMDRLTPIGSDPCRQHTRPGCGFGSYFLVSQYLRAGVGRQAAARRYLAESRTADVRRLMPCRRLL